MDEALKQGNDYAAHLTHWALVVSCLSVITLLGSIFVKPVGKKMRLTYLLYLVAWILLGLSLNCGTNVITDILNAAIQQNTRLHLLDLLVKMRDDTASQLFYFNWALYAFGAWLFIYLLWWIFNNDKPQKSQVSHFPPILS